MKFLDANGLALFTKKIFSKFISNIYGIDNKLTITKGDGTKSEINLNEVVRTDIIAENPPDDDNTNKIPSTSWVQKFTENNFLKKSGGNLSGNLNASGHDITAQNITANGYIYATAPDINDKNNKVPTTLWVKSYAPSKSGEGASGTWPINISGTADYAKKVNLINNREMIENGGADKYENEALIDNQANMIISSWNSIGFKTSADVSDQTIKLAIGTRTGNIETKGKVTAKGINSNSYIYTVAPDISADDNTVPTTHWVRTYINSLLSEKSIINKEGESNV